ncbi:13382_t:CDS:2 [Funneliformis caledonium]|uniref:13382_t:CDS:1 n=1 Tax=Funneliformis caledonium TaxID=1117310 RepID=A0A9N9D3C5_9GLOM|nr:13382_t:CDS:2 [Funneliformis caledonium]
MDNLQDNKLKFFLSLMINEWINDIQTFLQFSNEFKTSSINLRTNITFAISLINATIKLPSGIDSFEELSNALKKDISFTVFKNTNKRKLQLLKYISEREDGDTSKFISNFRQLCYNAEINDIDEQKKYIIQSLISNSYFLSEFFKRKDKINSTNELIKEFEEIAMDESNLVRNGSIVALKHVATGKYLSSISGLRYTTGSKSQLVFVSNYDSNALWNITFSSGKELASYTDTNIYLQHKSSSYFLENYNRDYKSPVTQHKEVSCKRNISYTSYTQWKFNNSKLENYQGCLKSNDILNLRNYDQQVFLRSHDFQFTIGNDTFQEVVCHNERLGGNDEVLVHRAYQAELKFYIIAFIINTIQSVSRSNSDAIAIFRDSEIPITRFFHFRKE